MIYREAWLSCGRMICLLPHPFFPSPVSKLSLILSLPVFHQSSFLTEEGGGEEEVGEEANHTTARKPGPLQITQYSLPVCLMPLG